MKQLNSENQKTLYQQFKLTNDPIIRKQLIESNLKYCFLLAKKYENILDIECGISVANEALIKAIDDLTWDESKGTLPTFLNTSVYWAILAEAEEMKPVKITKHMKKKYQENPIQFISTSTPINAETEITIGDTLVDEESDEKVDGEEVWFKLKSLVDDREFTVLKGVFAEKEDKVSMEKIGCTLGVSNQRCSQMKYQGILKAKRSNYLRQLWNNI